MPAAEGRRWRLEARRYFLNGRHYVGDRAKMNSFFRELKNRRVYRVALGYAVAAWLVIQIAFTVLPTFHVPEGLLQALVVLAALGFPAALMLAWAFDVTPSGIEKTPEGTGAVGARNMRYAWLLAAAGFAVAALAVGSYWLWHPWRNASTTAESSTAAMSAIDEKSVAVLPFENFSRDPDNAYFADGIQEEILTRLAKIADLKVISRTSTQPYQSKPGNIAEIGRQLGVAHILEGSVQKSGNAVRVNVQLIKAANDSHLWADTFDRKLTDIFSVESEVAKAIADQLRAKLTGQEEHVLAAKPTDNPEAYDAYLRGLAYTLKTQAPANSLGAQKYLREAVRLDPKFALSWALLSLVDARSYISRTLQPTAALREEARQGAETALSLQRNLGEALHAKGYYHYACLKDYNT